jgi:hypothetical protein
MNSNYRYILARDIDQSSDSVLLVCMLNPSTADETINDPTISRLCRLAENGGFGRLLVLNLLGVRETQPIDIWRHEDPIGPDNWQMWDTVLQGLNPHRDSIALAWGRAPTVQHQLLRFIPALIQASHHLNAWSGSLMTWVRNLDGSPRHPLYIPAHTHLKPYDLDCYINDLLRRYKLRLASHLERNED